jgi:hypothetical protein
MGSMSCGSVLAAANAAPTFEVGSPPPHCNSPPTGVLKLGTRAPFSRPSIPLLAQPNKPPNGPGRGPEPGAKAPRQSPCTSLRREPIVTASRPQASQPRPASQVSWSCNAHTRPSHSRSRRPGPPALWCARRPNSQPSAPPPVCPGCSASRSPSWPSTSDGPTRHGAPMGWLPPPRNPINLSNLGVLHGTPRYRAKIAT